MPSNIRYSYWFTRSRVPGTSASPNMLVLRSMSYKYLYSLSTVWYSYCMWKVNLYVRPSSVLSTCMTYENTQNRRHGEHSVLVTVDDEIGIQHKRTDRIGSRQAEQFIPLPGTGWLSKSAARIVLGVLQCWSVSVIQYDVHANVFSFFPQSPAPTHSLSILCF